MLPIQEEEDEDDDDEDEDEEEALLPTSPPVGDTKFLRLIPGQMVVDRRHQRGYVGSAV